MSRVAEVWLLTAERAALHEPTGTLVIADVHLGHGHSRQTRGDAVPTRRAGDDLAPLARLVPLGARRLLIAGDLFEAGYDATLSEQLAAWCQRVGLELLGLVPGNHDRLTAERPGLPLFCDGCRLGDWLVLHGDALETLPAPRVIQGHEHPCLRLSSRVQAPCYLVGQSRLILPAFSREAAGVNVLHDPRWHGLSCHAIVGTEVLDFGPVASLGERLRQVNRSALPGQLR